MPTDIPSIRSNWAFGPAVQTSTLKIYSRRITTLYSRRSTVVERRSLAGELSLSCARPAADVGKPSAIGQPTRPTQPFILSGSIK